MSKNVNGNYGVPHGSETSQEGMDRFDKLPKWQRDLINYAGYKINVRLFAESNLEIYPPSVIQQALDRGNAQNALAAYGIEHPQAYKGDVQ